MDAKQFLESYFDEAYRIIKHHDKYIKEYGLKEPKINYIDLFKFLQSAANFLYEIDYGVISGLPVKMYRDIESLLEYYKKLEKLNASAMFYNKYLPNLPQYKNLQATIKDLNQKISKYESILKSSENELKKYPTVPKDKEELAKYKALKKQNVDAIYYIGKYEEELENAKVQLKHLEKEEEKKFFPMFDKLKEEILKELKRILNTKLYYFDKLIWYNASKSPKVVKFFRDSSINGDINSKTFLKYQLQHIDEAKSLNSEWISYLKNLIKVIE